MDIKLNLDLIYNITGNECYIDDLIEEATIAFIDSMKVEIEPCAHLRLLQNHSSQS